MSMNYKNHYENLIRRAKQRKLDCYLEKHHIVPKCLGGDDSDNNIVELTAREHFIAHLLLHKINPNSFSLLKAALMMCVTNEKTHFGNRINNRRYSFLKESHSKMQSEHFKNGGSPTQDKRWISNEKETILVSIDDAEIKIKEGLYIAGKKARRDSCGHLVRFRCQQCRLWVAEAVETRNNKAIQLAETLYKEFIDSDCNSICEFARVKNTSQPRLTRLWSKHIKEYNNNKSHGKSFKK